MVSIVIPLYNSSNTIRFVVEEAITELHKLEIREYEFILVNDGSKDNVLDIVRDLANKNNRIKVIDLAKNSGQTNAMIAGYRYAKGDYIINMDDDMQTPGNEIGKLISAIEQNDLDVVFADYISHKESPFRLFGSFLNRKMAEVMVGKPKNLSTNSFFIMKRFVCREIIKYKNNYPYVYGIILSVTDKIGNVKIHHRERTNGKSNHTLHKLLALWLNGFLNFSVKPLRIATATGFVISALSAVIGLLLLINYMLHPGGVAGWTSLILTIIFFAGIQLVGIGILGEYLGRLYISSSNLPTYVIREKINITDEKEDFKQHYDKEDGGNENENNR